MCVVLVKVRHKNSEKEIMTFAILDNCSQGTFITTSLMEQLNISGIQTFINIKTLIGHQKESYIVEGLSVSKATVSDGNPKWIKLLSAFSKKEIPVDSCEIATARKLKKWDYLERISKELGDNEDISVDLLIGANCLQALEPMEVIPRQNDGPYAIKTALGWCVVGPIKAQYHNVVSCNRIAVIKADSGKMAEHHLEIEKGCEDIGVKEMLKKIYMTDFSEPCLKDADPVTKGLKEISYDDKRFLKIMQKEISKVGKHHQLPLPLRNNNMSLPNNQNLVEKRLMHLKKWFEKDCKFYEDYNKFMEEIISKGYAREVKTNHPDGRTFFPKQLLCG